MINNPLLDFSDLPRFGEIKPEHVTPAIDTLIQAAHERIAQVTATDTPIDWDYLIAPLEEATEQLGRAWSAVGHMNAVIDTPELRAAYNQNQPKLTEFWTALSHNLALYKKYKLLHAAPSFSNLSAPRKKIVENALRDFRLGGAELSEIDKQRFAEIQERLSALSTKFSENVLDVTNDYTLLVEDETQLQGLPTDVKAAAHAAAEQAGKAGWKFTLHFPSYFPVLQFADRRELREAMYRAHATRASEFGKPEWDNTALINEILQLRAEEAHLLGYNTFAELSLVPKMAPSPVTVFTFLEDMAQRARPFAERDLAELRAFAKDNLGITHLEAWDIAYVSEKLREQRYAFSEQEVKQYFPEPKVLTGLFRVIETLFSVRIKPDQAPTWHTDAHFFRIESAQGALIGQFYLDLYARQGKRGGAWMDDARTRRVTLKNGTSQTQTPAAFLTCNFSPPVGNNPALFSHDEVITLFHEFGHGLHHMLTRIDDAGVAGINGVEWDAVELPSQFMENFCWEWDVLSHMTAHVDTGAPLPRALFEKMLAAKNFQSGWQTLRQVAFSLFDMHLHHDFDPRGTLSVTDLMLQVSDRIHVFPSPRFSRMPNSFTHVFAGGYAAGYYSYKWAEVLSADAYSRFEETAAEAGVLNPQTGQSFLQEILQVGGSRPALESFKAFRGREPSIDALLRHQGMIEPNTV